MQLFQAVLFCGGLLFAAVYDIRTRTVSDGICIAIAMTGLVTISPASFLGTLVGAAPFYIGSGFGKNGAGDIALCAAAGFVLGPSRTIAGLTLFFVLYGFYVLTPDCAAPAQTPPEKLSACPISGCGVYPRIFSCIRRKAT